MTGMLFEYGGNFDAASSLYEKLLKKDPTNKVGGAAMVIILAVV